MKIRWLVLLVTGVVVLVFVRNMIRLSSILTAYLRADHNFDQPTARTVESQTHRHQQWIRLLRMRQQPTWESSSNGAFIHMGKTGGSSLSLLLRNGCHSFMPKPCRTVPLETIVSRLVGTYYHGKQKQSSIEG